MGLLSLSQWAAADGRPGSPAAGLPSCRTPTTAQHHRPHHYHRRRHPPPPSPILPHPKLPQPRQRQRATYGNA
ncbi:unnamed protein product [Merluccius merluccius]